MLTRREIQGIDRPLVWAVAALLGLGLLVLYSAGFHQAQTSGAHLLDRQLIWIGTGCLVGFLAIRVDYHRWLEGGYFLYGLSLLLLVLVLWVGTTRGGAQRWLNLGIVTIQPAELAKLSTILLLARYLGSHPVTAQTSFRTVTGALLLAAIPCGLILIQPDLGTAVVCIPIVLSMLLIWGAPARILWGLVGAGLALLPVGWMLLADYQRSRLLVFLNPDIDPLGAGYTINQSKIAIGSGGLFGKGWLAGTQSQLSFLPERHSDFIFSVVGEEWGLLGTSAALLLFLLFFSRALGLASQTRDPYGRLLIAGLIGMLATHVVVNTGMTIGLMPVVGLPLPFFSYGGSWMIICMAAVGMILSVGVRRPGF